MLSPETHPLKRLHLTTTHLVHRRIQVAKSEESHVVLHGVHQGRHTQLHQLLGAPQDILSQRRLESTQITSFSLKTKMGKERQ